MWEEHELEEIPSVAERRAAYGRSKDCQLLSGAFPDAKPIQLKPPVQVTRPLYYRPIGDEPVNEYAGALLPDNYSNAEAYVSAKDLYSGRRNAAGGAILAAVDSDAATAAASAVPKTGTCPNCKIGNVSQSFNMCGLLSLCWKPERCRVCGHVISSEE
ncbi:uncharacterized protein [Procambarus clarkii]|uniref:uncharacterized protein isoform X3 n=1 Tax=Procambarus clarkii TaxID=6728 RepID=UPI0037443563